VYDETGRPVAAARIVARPTRAQVLTAVADTTGDGTYQIRRLPPGPLILVWQRDAAGARARIEQIELAPGEDRVVDFHAAGEGSRLRGRVLDADGPVPGAVVALFPLDERGERGPGMRTGRTDGEGAFVFAGLVAGRYVLVVAAGTNGPRTSETVEIPAGGEAIREVRLHSGSISGRVVDAEGRGVGDTTVLVVRGDPPADATVEVLLEALKGQTLTAPDGTFEVPGLPSGRYVVRVRHDAHAAARSAEIALADGEARTGVEVRLARSGALVLVVSGPDGPVDAIAVLATDERGRCPSVVPVLRRGEGGRIAIPHLAPGNWRLVVDAEGLAPAVLDGLAVPDHGVLERRVVLVRGGTLRIRVADAAGAPAPGVRLLLEPLDGTPPVRLLHGRDLVGPPLVTESDGTAVIRNAPPGRFRVRVLVEEEETAAREVAVTDGEETELRIALPR
jgi:hypothetical protein